MNLGRSVPVLCLIAVCIGSGCTRSSDTTLTVYCGVSMRPPMEELANLSLKLGTIAAAIIWDATARLHPEEVELVPIERDYNVIAPIEIGVLSFSEHPELSMRLARYLASSQGEEVFDRHGYSISVTAVSN
jgi:ABC-type molybdate transport system substrate-binding protein